MHSFLCQLVFLIFKSNNRPLVQAVWRTVLTFMINHTWFRVLPPFLVVETRDVHVGTESMG